MGNMQIVFDHVHLISEKPLYAASWYAEKLDGKIIRNSEVLGAPQIYVAFGDVLLIIRGQRPGEKTDTKQGLQWGADHFGFRIYGDFDAFCGTLKQKGVIFAVEPRDFNPNVRIAFIEGPDGVRIELMSKKEP